MESDGSRIQSQGDKIKRLKFDRGSGSGFFVRSHGVFTTFAERRCSLWRIHFFSRAFLQLLSLQQSLLHLQQSQSFESESQHNPRSLESHGPPARQVAGLLSTLARLAARAARFGLQETAAACRAALGLLSLLLQRPPSAGGEGDGRAGAAAGQPAEGRGNGGGTPGGHGGFTPGGGAPDAGGGPGDDERWRTGYAVEDFLDYF
jgi:hypothetical protein